MGRGAVVAPRMAAPPERPLAARVLAPYSPLLDLETRSMTQDLALDIADDAFLRVRGQATALVASLRYHKNRLDSGNQDRMACPSRCASCAGRHHVDNQNLLPIDRAGRSPRIHVLFQRMEPNTEQESPPITRESARQA